MSVPAALSTEQRLLPAGLMSLLVHIAFVGLLVYTVQWQNHPAAPVQAELWSALPPLPTPEPPVEPVPAPAPVAETPAPAPPQPAPPPPPVEKPAIVVEKAPAKPVEPPKPAADPDKAKMAREEAELKRLDKEMRAKEAREKAVQAQREQAEEQRLEKLQRDAEAKLKADAQAAQANLIKGASDRITAKIRENTIVPASVTSAIAVVVRFVLLPDGSVLDGSIHVVSSSGNPVYDEAVQRAIVASQPLPMPDDIVARRALRDLKLTVNHTPH